MKDSLSYNDKKFIMGILFLLITFLILLFSKASTPSVLLSTVMGIVAIINLYPTWISLKEEN